MPSHVYAVWMVSQSFFCFLFCFGDRSSAGRESIAPLLFAMYLNDFKGWVDGASSGLTDISAMVGSRASDHAE